MREPAKAPRLADGVELLGEYQGSGYSQPPSLVRRADGQVIQMSRLLYQVTCRIDGSRGPAAIAELVSEDLGRSLTADQVRHLITSKLFPLGIVADKSAPAVAPKADPLLALRARGTLLPERAANAAGLLLRPLFRGPLVVAVVASVLAVDYWLFAAHGLGGGLQQVLRDPVDLLIVLGLTLVSAVFHECGHAVGCRYGGARPGVIGVGIYLVWLSFFTNVTDSYRLSRAGRLRTDLGGLYFNLIFILALVGRDPAPGHRHHAPGDGGAAAPVRPLRRLLHPQRPRRRARPVRPRRPDPPERGIQRAQGPAGHRPPAPGPDRGDRLGPVRHPAAHAQHGVPGAAPARDQPGAVAGR
jgi:putative peptide zinc metalloprotease protein